MLLMSNLYSTLCLLYLSKTRIKKKRDNQILYASLIKEHCTWYGSIQSQKIKLKTLDLNTNIWEI